MMNVARKKRTIKMIVANSEGSKSSNTLTEISLNPYNEGTFARASTFNHIDEYNPVLCGSVPLS